MRCSFAAARLLWPAAVWLSRAAVVAAAADLAGEVSSWQESRLARTHPAAELEARVPWSASFRRRAPRPPRGEAFVQRSARHQPESAEAASRIDQEEPLDVEDIDLVWGVPKIVWVITADIFALFLFITMIWAVTNLAKKRLDDG
mmetsp:Transcript_97723/g.273481  ORF Transcript_97723/g.273481 Transcript_97723/m.273481 type:complete len:145 (-) Transcript_97723:223-657(-)